MRHPKYCPMCKAKVIGRPDKKFCSPKCKATYHRKLTDVTEIAAKSIDKILHRNRSILLEIMGKNSTRKSIDKVLLDKKKFNYSYVTGYHVNKQGKMVHHVYDFSYLIFSDQGVIIFRKSTR